MLNGRENCLIINSDTSPTMKEIFEVIVENGFIQTNHESYSRWNRLIEFKIENKECEVFYCNDGRVIIRSENSEQAVIIYEALKQFRDINL